ncbi:MAG: hypothetical protein E5W93_06115 [Mesorhizobium sp.]|nr:MAG: hypothetical protein E5W93_06115 [Mesorhizobium sp.]
MGYEAVRRSRFKKPIQPLAQGGQWLNLLAEHERAMFGRLSVREQAELRRLLSKLWQEDEPEPV